jgi:DNA-binding GntR family transcriptional regulator
VEPSLTKRQPSLRQHQRADTRATMDQSKAKTSFSNLVLDGSKDGTRALADTVADTLVNAIAQGVLQPGQRLIESDIAGQMNISRVPVREAIKILQTQGVLKAAPNQGVRIASFEDSDFEKVTEVRLALERIAARHAIETYRREPRRIDLLRENVSRMKRASHWSDWAELRRLDVQFHHEFCKASENEIVLSLWEALARRINIIFGREIASERNFQVVISQHEKLIEQFETGYSDIEDAIQSHILRLHRNHS